MPDATPLDDLAAWDAAGPEARHRTAAAVAGRLPPPFQLSGLQRRALGGHTHELAFFAYGTDTFALIPGAAAAVLGYDRTHPFVASPEQLAEFEAAVEGLITLGEYLDRYLTPLRTVPLRPFLLEVTPHSLSVDWSLHDGELDLSVVQDRLAGGFDLPAVDQWEYACAARSRSLFRWGNDTPPESSHRPAGGFERHARPNAFGLTIAADTYKLELCVDLALRGGDGGGAVHGGHHGFFTWLPLASAYFNPPEATDGWYIDELYVRRTFNLSE